MACTVNRDTGHIELLSSEMFAGQISDLSAHGMHSAYSRTPAGATGLEHGIHCQKKRYRRGTILFLGEQKI